MPGLIAGSCGRQRSARDRLPKKRGGTPCPLPAAVCLLGPSACTAAGAYVTSTRAWALSSVAAPTNCTASIGAMQNFGGYLGGALAPTVTGIIVGRTGSFVLALVVGAAIGVVSATCYLFVVQDPITEQGIDRASGAALAWGDAD